MISRDRLAIDFTRWEEHTTNWRYLCPGWISALSRSRSAERVDDGWHTQTHTQILRSQLSKFPTTKKKNIHRRATSTRLETLSCVGRNGPELGDSLAELRLILTAEWGKTRKSSSWARDGPDDENSTFEPGVTSATAQSKRAFHCLDVTFAFGRFTTQ